MLTVTKRFRTKINQKTEEAIYLIIWILLFGTRSFNITEASSAYRFIIVGAIAAFLVKLFVTRYSRKEYLVIGVLIGIALVVYIHTGEKALLLYFILMLGLKNVQLDHVIGSGAVMMGASLVWHIFTRVFGLLPEFYYFANHAGRDEFRHSLGFPHPTTLQVNCMIFTMLVMLMVCNRKRQIRILAGAIMAIFNLYVYAYSSSRTALIITFLFLGLYTFFIEIYKPFGFLVRLLLQLIYPLCAFVVTGVILGMNDELAEKLISRFGTIGSRLYLCRYYLSIAPLSLFGHRIEYASLDTSYGIDNAYCNLLILNGIVPFVVISILYIWFIHDLVGIVSKRKIVSNSRNMTDSLGNTGNKEGIETSQTKAVLIPVKGGQHFGEAVLAITISIMIMGMTEQFLFNLSCKNIIFLFVGEWIFLKTSGQTYGERNFSAEKVRIFVWREGTCEYKRVLRSFIVTIIAVVFCLIFYFIRVQKPIAIYADSNYTERGVTDASARFFTSEEIETLRQENTLIINYKDEKSPLYQYNDHVAFKEYCLKGFSYSFWIGAGVGIAGWIHSLLKVNSKKGQAKRNENGS